MARDRDGRNVIHVGDECSVLTPPFMAHHNGVGEVTAIDGRMVTITDALGRAVTLPARDVAVDWSDYPAED